MNCIEMNLGLWSITMQEVDSLALITFRLGSHLWYGCATLKQGAALLEGSSGIASGNMGLTEQLTLSKCLPRTEPLTPLGLCLGAFLLPSIQSAYKRHYSSDSVLSARAMA